MSGYPAAGADESEEERRVKKKVGKHCSIGKKMKEKNCASILQRIENQGTELFGCF